MLPRKLADYERSLKPRLHLVQAAPDRRQRIPWAGDKRQSRQSSALTVIIVAFVFAVTGIVMRACGVS